MTDPQKPRGAFLGPDELTALSADELRLLLLDLKAEYWVVHKIRGDLMTVNAKLVRRLAAIAGAVNEVPS